MLDLRFVVLVGKEEELVVVMSSVSGNEVTGFMGRVDILLYLKMIGLSHFFISVINPRDYLITHFWLNVRQCHS